MRTGKTAQFSVKPPAMHERLLSAVGVAMVSLLAWIYLIHLATEMSDMPAMAVTTVPRAWSGVEAALMFIMWQVMMIAMMLPSATMMIMTFATVNRRRRDRGQHHVGTLVFATGYGIAWGGFSIAATAAQWGLEQLALLPSMSLALPSSLGGGLLIAAGIYQFMPFKHACLRHCRSPLDFIINRWRDGPDGALTMGIEHGLYCLGCCWVLMVLLFVFGVMNLLWIAALTVLVLVEKAAPGGPMIGRIGGIVMIVGGIAMAGLAGEI